MTTDPALRKVALVLEMLAEEYWRQPLDFLNEHDVQAVTYGMLRKEFGDPDLRLEGSRCKLDKATSGFETLKFNPVKAEYSFELAAATGDRSKIEKKRFDLAVLSPDLDKSSTVWYQAVRVGVEIKLLTPVDGKQPWEDVDKLRRYRARALQAGRAFTGLSLLFVHPGAEFRLEDPSYRISQPIESVEDGVALHIVTAHDRTQIRIEEERPESR